jgi:putative spermidine/putrescine transport system permease protein
MRLEIGSAYTLLFFIIVLPVLWSLQWLVVVFERRHGS